MGEQKSILEKTLGALKTAVFEKGTLIYRLNIPAFRKSRKRIEASPRKDRIRVGFIVQVPQNWAVLQSVYEHARQDERFEPVVILVPELEFAFYVKLKAVLWEKTYDFGEKTFGSEALRAYDLKTGGWIDPESLKLDYVFIPRPYETYLPKSYRASAWRKFTKVCYVPYAFPILDDWHVMYNTHFVRNVSLVFCEKKSSRDYVAGKFAQTVRAGDQKALLCGYPKFDLIEAHAGNESPLWPRKRSGEIFRMMWTPRWTTDPRLGGSNFFRYKDRMIEWAENDRSVDLLFRPHPMALEHYVSAGLMTREEEDAYLKRYGDCENAAIDRTTAYYDTFYSSDCLITDISSIIMDYLFTGRPIIYCRFADDEPFSLPELRDSLYIVDSFEGITDRVEKIRRGEDEKKELRQQLVRMLKPGNTAAEVILQALSDDYRGAGK